VAKRAVSLFSGTAVNTSLYGYKLHPEVYPAGQRKRCSNSFPTNL